MPDRSWSSYFAATTSGGPPLRVGLALDDDLTVTRAQASIIDDIRSSDVAEVVLVLVTEGRRRARPGSVGWRLYNAVDRRRIAVADDPHVRRPIGPMLPSVEIAGGGATLPRATEAGLDVILDLSRAGIDAAFGGAARHGIWALATSVSLRDDLIHVSLRRRSSTATAPLVLGSGVFANDPLALGPSRATASYGSTHLVIQALRDLHERGPSHAAERAGAGSPARRATAPRVPTNWEVARWVGPVVAGKLAGKVRRTLRGHGYIEHWRVALRPRAGGLDPDGRGDMSGFHWLESPRGHLYADPFLVDRGGRTWLFFEDYSYAGRRGVIAAAEVAADGRVGDATVVLASAGHLSYPYVFLDGDDAFMVPESGNEGMVRLYRATDFPFHWEPVADLFHGRAVDTSVWHEGGRWWFFTTLQEPRGGASMLMLFSSDDLVGPWESHPSNPISLDVRDARGAGRIFRLGGALIRPSQDCSRTYGYSFSLNEIVTLTPTDYAERRLRTVLPDWDRGLSATHTYNRADRFEVTDGRVERPSTLVL